MPEGDTIFRAAKALHLALTGKTVTGFETMLPQLSRVHDDTPLTGRTVERAESVGKHLLIHFSGGLVLRTHMRMNGSWHLYRPGEKWRRSRSAMRIVITTADFVAVAFNVPVAELIAEGKLERHDELRKLGPDLLADRFDPAEVLRRLRERPQLEMGQALLNQRVLAGAGNVFKSEILFLAGIHPFAPVGSVPDAQLEQVVALSRKLLRANVLPSTGAGIVTYFGFRRTTGRSDPAERLWVYGRGGKPCRRCGSPIAFRRQGLDARVTYWCPRCQPEQPAAGVTPPSP